MSQKFLTGGTVPGNWEFRQFFLMYPSGPADEGAARRLRAEAKKGLFSRWGWGK